MSSEREFPRSLKRLATLQAQRPWLFILVAVLSLIPTAWATSRLGFKADFAELLPENKDSVIEMRRVSKRLPGASTLSLVAQIEDGSRRQALRTFVDTLVPKLRALGPEWVGGVDFGVREAREFFEKNALFYASLAELEAARSRIVERYDWEVARAQGTLLDEDEPPEPITADSLERQLLQRKEQMATGAEPSYPAGYYESPDGKYSAILLKTPVSGKQAIAELRRRVEAAVRETDPKRFDPTLRVSYTGDVITGQEEYDAIVEDLSHVGAGGIAGVLISVFLYFLRVRTILTMGGTLLVGLLWTFGITRYTIGYLNSSTGFLVSIIAGNGINYGIIYMARYVEARRDEGVDVAEAVLRAHRDSWIPTLASAATAALAYGSLMVTDFRGFKHFGIIGGYGMLICWTTTYLFMPPLLAASERIWPAYRSVPAGGKKRRPGGVYGILFAKIAFSAPRWVFASGLLIGLASVAISVHYFATSPMEYDMKRVRTDDAPDQSGTRNLSHKVDRVVGRLGQEGMAIMTDRVDQVPLLEAELEKRRKAASPDKKPFERVVSVFALLPADQEKKLPLIDEMRDRISRARKRGLVSDADWQRIEPHLPLGELKPIGIADLPEQVARPFTERDGTRGRIVYIVPKSGESVWDAKYLMRWADSFRSVQLPSGEVIKGSGRAVIYADMIQTIVDDAPKAILVAALGTILVILIAFRGSALSFGVFVPWLFGIGGLLAFLEFAEVKLNFLNFVAIPITIGIGAEYAHNIMQRYRIEGPGRLRYVVLQTGGAVTLCSLTTTIGYLALLISINRGIRTFGLSAAIGELTCLCAAVLWLPAALVVLTKNKLNAATARVGSELEK